jgi:hypothetical protein
MQRLDVIAFKSNKASFIEKRMGNSTGQMFGVLFGWLIMSG